MTEKDIRLGFDTSTQARKLFVREMSVSIVMSACVEHVQKAAKESVGLFFHR